MQVADSNSTVSFYVYLHRRATDGRVFYVGKGKCKRAFDKSKRSTHWKRIVAKHGYTVEFVQRDIQEWYAFELEKDLIAYYGRENLCNRTDGGDGVSGYKHSKEAKRKISINRTKPNLNGCKNSFFGKSHTEEVKKKLRDGMRLIIAKNGNPMQGKSRPDISGAKHHKSRKVMCIDNGMTFDCIKDAKNWLKKTEGIFGDIGACVQGRKHSSGGMQWCYA